MARSSKCWARAGFRENSRMMSHYLGRRGPKRCMRKWPTCREMERPLGALHFEMSDYPHYATCSAPGGRPRAGPGGEPVGGSQRRNAGYAGDRGTNTAYTSPEARV